LIKLTKAPIHNIEAKEKEREGGRKKGLMKSTKAPIHTRKEVAIAAGIL